MSLAAARAMRDLAECIQEEADECGPGNAFAILSALGRAHARCADRLEVRAKEAEKALGPGMPMPEKRRARG